MANVPSLGVTGLIDISGVMDTEDKLRPNVDYHYGPYASTSAAFAALQADEMNVLGKTVGVVQADGSIREYWFKSSTSSAAGLVAKFADSATIPMATATVNGLMSASDKAKLDNISISSLAYADSVLTIDGNAFNLAHIGKWTEYIDLGSFESLDAGIADAVQVKYAFDENIKLMTFTIKDGDTITDRIYVFQVVGGTYCWQYYYQAHRRFKVRVSTNGTYTERIYIDPAHLFYDNANRQLKLLDSEKTYSVPYNNVSRDAVTLPLATTTVAGLVLLSTTRTNFTDFLPIGLASNGQMVADCTDFNLVLTDLKKRAVKTMAITDLDAKTLPLSNNVDSGGDYWIVNNAKVAGRLFAIDDGMNHKTTQILLTNSSPTGITNFGHEHKGIAMYYRFYGVTANDVPARQWTDWAPLADATSVTHRLGDFDNLAAGCAAAASDAYAANPNVCRMSFVDSATDMLYLVEQYRNGDSVYQTLIGDGAVKHRLITLSSGSVSEVEPWS